MLQLVRLNLRKVVVLLLAGKKIMKEIVSWILAFLIPIIVVLALNIMIFTISGINQSSMHNTLFEGDLVYFNRFADKITDFKREDIVLFLTDGREKNSLWDEVRVKLTDVSDLFRPKEGRINERYVKRIIGMPGDIIDIRDGSVYINDVKENEAYVVGVTLSSTVDFPLTVPDDQLFVLGDNREVSMDSRHFGCISIRSLEGKAAFMLWPPSRVRQIK
jgi:signal peptidase I